MWIPVCHTNDSHTNESGFESAWIVAWPNKFSHEVTVHLHTRDTQRQVHMPWEMRFQGFSEFLRLCSSTMRIEVWVKDGQLTRYALWANVEEMRRQIQTGRGCLDGEPYVVSALRHFLPLSTLVLPPLFAPSSLAPSTRSKAALLPPCWSKDHPLTERQRASVEWMRGMEACIGSGKNQIVYEACVPIVDSLLHYDLYLEMIRTDEPLSLPKLKARFRGGVLCDDVGTGKTACALALSSSERNLLPGERFTPPRGMLAGKGTLILVPMNIAHQWREEVDKFTSGLKTIILTTAKDLKVHTGTDLMEADLVITTTNYLRLPSVREAVEETVKRALGLAEMERKEAASLKNVKIASRCLPKEEIRNACVELLFWPRLIVDEFHEYTKERTRVLRSLYYGTIWGLTATPSISSPRQIYPLLLEPKIADEESSHHHHPCLQAAIWKTLFRQFSTNSEPSVTHIVHRVVMSGRERILHETASHLPIEKMNEILLSCDERTETSMVVQAAKERIHSLQRRAEAEEKRMMIVEEDGKDALSDIDSRLHVAHSSLSFLETRLNHTEQHEEVCPICMEARPRLLAQCGHMYCHACVKRIEVCSLCREEIVTVHDVSSSSNSKLRYVVDLVDDLCVTKGEQALLFCRSQPFLTHVCGTVRARSSLMSGTTTRRASLIRRFQDEGEIDMLAFHLSDGVSSAGCHLSSASHIIFAHSVEDDAVERQAIGRATRGGRGGGASVHHVLWEQEEEDVSWSDRHPKILSVPLET